MRVGSLFSGIGGIELGLERAGGFETAWFVENDPHAQAILRKHWPTAQVYDDITQVDFGAVPRIDVLTGGFPCQDISKAGKGAGITGSRSGLWKHYLRAIGILRPRYIIAENVSLLTKRGLDEVLCDLAAIGYDAEWHCLPAAAVGAPHKRDRIFILAYPHSNGAPIDSRGVPEEDGVPGRGIPRSLSGGCGSSQATKGVVDPGSIGWWATEPLVGRMADGVPLRVDRIKRLGNAVVPQVAEAVGRAIREAD